MTEVTFCEQEPDKEPCFRCRLIQVDKSIQFAGSSKWLS